MNKVSGFFIFGFIAIASFLAAGCSNYTSTTRQARDEFYNAKYSETAKVLEKGAHEESLDQLLYLFDRATALHHSSEYDESNKDFHLADKLSEIKDYTSLSAEAATIITNDHIIPYKGEDFEKVLVSQYLALNYLMKRKYEDALVECRRVNHKLHQMITKGKRKYKQNAMAMYLAGAIYESQGEYNDAYVDYQGVYKLMPELPYLREDLYRLAWRNGIQLDMEKWAKQYGLSADDQKRIRSTANDKEIIVILENGKSPEKQQHPNWSAIPHYVPRYNPSAYAQILINGEDRGRSQLLYNIEQTAIENLDEKYSVILAKRIAGMVVKEVAANQMDEKVSPLAGAIFRLGMYAIDQADLRSWLTLPKDFQIFRTRVAPGSSYKIQAIPKSVDGSTVAGIGNQTSFEKVLVFDDSNAKSVLKKKKDAQRNAFVIMRI